MIIEKSELTHQTPVTVNGGVLVETSIEYWMLSTWFDYVFR